MFYLTGDAAANCVASARSLKNCLGYIKCIAHGLHNLLTNDLKKIEAFVDYEKIIKKIKKTRLKLVYKNSQLKEIYEKNQNEDVKQYIQEWEDSLVQQILADEDIQYTNEENIDKQRHEQEMMAISGQENFSSFKTNNVTWWFSTLTMLESYDKNFGIKRTFFYLFPN